MVTDYCKTPEFIERSYSLNEENNYISFAAPRRELDIIPGAPIFNENKNVYLSEKNNKKNYHLKKTIKLLEIENATTVGSANKNTKINKKVDCVVTKAFASTKKTRDIANSFLEKPFTLMLLKGKLKTINKEIAEANISKENYEIIKIENEKEKHILKIQNE